jgi:hypothetical protein
MKTAVNEVTQDKVMPYTRREWTVDHLIATGQSLLMGGAGAAVLAGTWHIFCWSSVNLKDISFFIEYACVGVLLLSLGAMLFSPIVFGVVVWSYFHPERKSFLEKSQRNFQRLYY